MGNLWAVYALFITTLLLIALLFSYYIYLAKPNGIKKSIYETKEKLKELSPTIKFLLLVSVILVILSFWMPFFLTKNAFIEEFDFSKTGNIGDTFGGILNPFIAMAAVIVTGLAFYMQYQANKQVQDQFKLQQFESQFYKMLELHKENVNEMEIEGYEYRKKLSSTEVNEIFENAKNDKYKIKNITDRIHNNQYFNNIESYKSITGRKIFYLISKEYECIYRIVEYYYFLRFPEDFMIINNKIKIDSKNKFIISEIAYNIFFSGKDIFSKQINKNEIPNIYRYNRKLKIITDKNVIIKNDFYSSCKKFQQLKSLNKIFFSSILNDLEILRTCHKCGVRYAKHFRSFASPKESLHLDFSYKPFGGHQIRLGHYYRHMFALAKYVVTQPNEFLSYQDKRKYLKIFRAQLSNHEIVMLYYNWLGGYGEDWEVKRHLNKSDENGNKFFTDYRILHNLNAHIVLDEFNPKDIFSNHDYDKFSYKEGENKIDSLFEVHGIESRLSEEENNRLKRL